jgi:glycosyltransferase involved in cell wall biosynthesis
LNEAIACNSKIVSTNVGGIPELSDSYSNMVLVNPGSSILLENALNFMLSANYSSSNNDFLSSWDDNARHLLDFFDNHI